MSIDAPKPAGIVSGKSLAEDGSLKEFAALRRRSNIALFLLSFAVFFLSPVKDTRSDPQYSILESESILRHGTPALNEVSIPGLDQVSLPSHPDMNVMRPFYQLVRVNGRILYSYPHGSSLLSIPLVALLDAVGISAIDSKGVYSRFGELWIQATISSFLMAIATCLFFKTAGEMLPLSCSIVVALGAAFGTQIWSSASRALWSHTWEVLLAACLVLLLLNQARRTRRGFGVTAGTLVSWMYLVRPNGSIVVVAVSLLVLTRYRSEVIPYAAVGLFWFGSFIAYSWATFGSLFPDYYRRGAELQVHGWLAGLAGCLISPSRGLLIFVPWLVSVAYVVVRYRKNLPYPHLALLSTGIIVAQLLMISAWPVWWGGWSYGPRLFTDLVPWFVLLAVLGSRAYLDSRKRLDSGDSILNGHPWVSSIGVCLIIISILINGYGAISIQTRLWNAHPNIDKHLERLWDWEHPQFLANGELMQNPIGDRNR